MTTFKIYSNKPFVYIITTDNEQSARNAIMRDYPSIVIERIVKSL